MHITKIGKQNTNKIFMVKTLGKQILERKFRRQEGYINMVDGKKET
jgi:hypothetical protein